MLSGLVNGVGPISHGAYTVVAADDTANSTVIDTGLSAIEMVQCEVVRSGKVVASDIAVSYTGGALTVGDGASYVLTTGDIVHWLAIGK